MTAIGAAGLQAQAMMLEATREHMTRAAIESAATAPAARVNVVAPGWTVSPMTADSLDDASVARATATMALRKVATAEDVAHAIAFLLSPVAAGHVTGQVVTVAGGMEGRLLHPVAALTAPVSGPPSAA